MSESARPPEERPKARRDPRDSGSWAVGHNILRVSDVPEGAVNLNVDGRRVIGALQGFGQLWQKTYTLRLAGADVTPEEVVALWKREFPDFHPPESRFYPSLDGVEPGEIMLINANVQGMPVYTGVMVLYSDDVSFTVMTAEGLPEAGWNTFSAYEEDGVTVAQIQSRGGGGGAGNVDLEKACVDPKLQWYRVGNIWHNAGLRSVLYTLAAQARVVSGLFRRRS
jgi:hypothetical protein